MRRVGFTLMELLIVISIIMLLMGLLFPIFTIAKNHAMKVKARTLIGSITAACRTYQVLNGAYPDTNPNPMPPIYVPFQSVLLTSGTGTPVTAPTLASDESNWVKVSSALLVLLQKTDRDTFGQMSVLVDPWKKSIRYRPCQYYPWVAGATPAIDSDTPPLPDSFQVWSAGPNERDEYGDASSDDITNWR